MNDLDADGDVPLITKTIIHASLAECKPRVLFMKGVEADTAVALLSVERVVQFPLSC